MMIAEDVAFSFDEVGMRRVGTVHGGLIAA
jgi:hypothetical protein